MPRENRFEVEYAKSNMATCRVCMAKIPKGSLRLGHLQVDAAPGDAAAVGGEEQPEDKEAERLQAVAGAARWHHFECFNKMKGAKWMAANLPVDASSMKGFSDIKKQDQKKVLALWKLFKVGSAPAPPASGKRKAESAAGAAEKKAKTEAVAAAKLAKLTSVQGVLKAKEFQKIQKLEGDVASRTAAQLQAELGLNNQVRSGKKDELVQRVAEGRLLGALPPCPRCEKGQIHWSRVGGWYSCPGHFDAEAKVQKRCNYRSQELTRTKWKLK